jgi:site-specific recombinase XerD
MSVLRQNFIQQLELGGFSPKTISAYVAIVLKLSRFHNRSPLLLDRQQICDYLHYELKVNKLNPSTINQHIGALKTFYRRMAPDSNVIKGLPGMKVPAKLPVVLSCQEVEALFRATTNIKHQAILELMYSSGIRVGECVSLVPQDIDRRQMLLRVRSGKGAKERYTVLSNRALQTISTYYRLHKPTQFLFEGRGGNKYSVRSIMKIVEKAVMKAGINKKATSHTLRHSFATHLLDNGVSLRVIQKLLGHSHIQSTTVYTHVSNQSITRIISPLDMLNNREGANDQQ